MLFKSIIFVLGLTTAFPILSAQWSLQPTLNPSFEYDDNISMEATDKESSLKYSLRPTIISGYETERTKISLSTGYSIERFSSTERESQSNPFLQLNTNRSFQRSSLRFGLSFREDAFRDTAEEDTGNFSSTTVVKTQSFSPTYSYNVTERDSLIVNLGYVKREYSTNEFRDNDTKSASVSWLHQFSERVNGFTSFSSSKYESGNSDNSSSENKNHNFSVGLDYQLTERWLLSGEVGVRYLDTSTGSLSTSSTGSSFNFSASHKSEIGNLSINLQRRLNPSSTGDVNEQDIFNISWTKGLSEKLSFSISSRYIETTSAAEDSENKRQNFNVSPRLTWKLTEKTSVNASYRFRQQKNTNEAKAEGNIFSLTISHDWQGYRFSR